MDYGNYIVTIWFNIIYWGKLFHHFQSTFVEASPAGHRGRVGKSAASTRVGKRSTNSVSSLVDIPLSVKPGTCIIIGARVESSKFVCLHHSLCSPGIKIWKTNIVRYISINMSGSNPIQSKNY